MTAAQVATILILAGLFGAGIVVGRESARRAAERRRDRAFVVSLLEEHGFLAKLQEAIDGVEGLFRAEIRVRVSGHEVLVQQERGMGWPGIVTRWPPPPPPPAPPDPNPGRGE